MGKCIEPGCPNDSYALVDECGYHVGVKAGRLEAEAERLRTTFTASLAESVGGIVNENEELIAENERLRTLLACARAACERELALWPGDDGDRNPTDVEMAVARVAAALEVSDG